MKKLLAMLLTLALVASFSAIAVSAAGISDANYRDDTGWTKLTAGTMDPEDGVYVDIPVASTTTTAVKFKVIDGKGGWASCAELKFNFTSGAPKLTAGAQSFDYSEGYPEYAIDDDESTFWHSLWNEDAYYNNVPDGEFVSAGDDFPQVLIVEFDKASTFDKISYLARPGVGNGTVYEYEIWVANYTDTAAAVVNEPVPDAVQDSVVADTPAPVSTSAPKTGDMGIIIALAILAGTAFVTVKTTRARNKV